MRATTGEDRQPSTRYIWARASSVYGGAEQIQRNIIAQRVLRLATPMIDSEEVDSVSESELLLETRGHTAIVTFNRPDRLNALSEAMIVGSPGSLATDRCG